MRGQSGIFERDTADRRFRFFLGFFEIRKAPRELERAPRQSASEAEARWADFSRAKD
jgi:hypothetical protein